MMKRILNSALVVALAATSVATPVLADNGHGNNHGTPPGLAKKPGGMPPGQYKKLHNPHRIDDLSRYRLPEPRRGEMYVVQDNEIYRVTRDTMTVIAAVGIVSDWLR